LGECFFNPKKQKMKAIKKDCSMSMLKANLVLIPFMGVAYTSMLGVIYLVWGTVDSNGFFDSSWFRAFFIGGVVVHEAIHGITWMIAGKVPSKEIKYGIAWKTLTPFAHSKIPMPKVAYQIGAAMPAILLGILPYLIGLITGSVWVMYFGALFTVMASGDALVLWMIKDVEEDQLIEDHPSRAGCYVVTGIGDS